MSAERQVYYTSPVFGSRVLYCRKLPCRWPGHCPIEVFIDDDDNVVRRDNGVILWKIGDGFNERIPGPIAS